MGGRKTPWRDRPRSRLHLKPSGWDVAWDVIAVGDDPDAALIDFPLEPEGIIDDHFAGKEDHGEIVAEAPGLDRVRDMRFEGFAAIEGVMRLLARKPSSTGSLGSLFRGWRGLEVVPVGARACEACVDRARSGVRADLRRRSTSRRRRVLQFGVVEVTPWLGIRVGPAADDCKGGRAGKLPLDLVARVAGPFVQIWLNSPPSVVQWHA